MRSALRAIGAIRAVGNTPPAVLRARETRCRERARGTASLGNRPRLDLDQSIRLNQAFALSGDIIERGALRSLEAAGHPFVEGLAVELAQIK